MDVNSLLNANPSAVEQQKHSEVLRIPTRNRTPWDAGGYSLPINTASSGSTTPPAKPQNNDSNTETPTSPRHRFSDSRSSLSSFTSSLQSATHSRFSSMSTVSSAYQMHGLVGEAISPLAAKIQPFELNSFNLPPEECHRINDTARAPCSFSPTRSPRAIAPVAANNTFGKHSARLSFDGLPSISTDNGPDNISGSEVLSQERPISPSDAILIKRSSIPALRVDTGDHDLNGASEWQP